MITEFIDIYIESFQDDNYRFGYKLLIESSKDTRTLEILHHLCPSAFSKVYNVEEEIEKVINSYEHVTVYYDPYNINIFDYLKKNCKHANFEKMRSPVSSKKGTI